MLALPGCVALEQAIVQPTPDETRSDKPQLQAREVYGANTAFVGAALRYPVAVTGGPGSLFVADAAAGQVFRIDRATGAELRPVAAATARTQLYRDRDATLWLVDADRAELVQLTETGRVIARQQADLRRPVDVARSGLPPATWVLDNGRNRLLELTVLGSTVTVRGGAGSALPGMPGGRAIAATRERLFVLDGDGAVWSLSTLAGGRPQPTEELPPLLGTQALAVDDCGRIYRGDSAGRLRIDRAGESIERQLAVTEITDLWWHGDELFVADAAGAAVHVFGVRPRCR